MTRPVLICRPQPGADATAARAHQMGLATRLYPLFVMEPLPWVPPHPASFDALMLTSANALRHGGHALAGFHALPVFAVGEATARAARSMGFRNVAVAGPDVQAMTEEMAKSGYRAVLHLCGAHFREPDRPNLSISHVPVYQAAETGDAEGLTAALGDRPIILVHSPRAGSRFSSLTPPPLRSGIAVVAISAAALEACGTGWAEARRAGKPDDPAMLAIALEICQKDALPPSQTVSGNTDE